MDMDNVVGTECGSRGGGEQRGKNWDNCRTAIKYLLKNKNISSFKEKKRKKLLKSHRHNGSISKFLYTLVFEFLKSFAVFYIKEYFCFSLQNAFIMKNCECLGLLSWLLLQEPEY